MLSPSLAINGMAERVPAKSVKPTSMQLTGWIKDMNFTTLDLTEEHLVDFAVAVFDKNAITELLGLTSAQTTSFVLACKEGYRLEPTFHNFAHAIQVLHGTNLLMEQHMQAELGIASPLDRLMTCVAALTHDLQHEGLNNGFHKQTQSLLFQQYPSSTLERHHYANALSMCEDHGLFAALSDTDRKQAQELLEVLIIHTDMGLHGKLLAFVQASQGQEIVSREDLGLALAVLLHSADLYSPWKTYEIGRPWALRLQREFNRQADIEASLKLPSLPFMQASGECALASDQIAFIGNVALKWYAAMALTWPTCTALETRTQAQLDQWHLQLAKL
jgi:high affinity cAMP-specific 3',5'-cyclic phosphodiesterase 7